MVGEESKTMKTTSCYMILRHGVGGIGPRLLPHQHVDASLVAGRRSSSSCSRCHTLYVACSSLFKQQELRTQFGAKVVFMTNFTNLSKSLFNVFCFNGLFVQKNWNQTTKNHHPSMSGGVFTMTQNVRCTDRSFLKDG